MFTGTRVHADPAHFGNAIQLRVQVSVVLVARVGEAAVVAGDLGALEVVQLRVGGEFTEAVEALREVLENDSDIQQRGMRRLEKMAVENQVSDHTHPVEF